MSESIDFMELLHEACSQEEMSMDEYLVEKLHNVFPYSLVFVKYDGGE